MTISTLRYQLPAKAIKSDCPQCGPKHRRTLSRYVDTRMDELLPATYGRCDRESNCGYHLSPYTKSPAGLSYADQVYAQWKEEQQHNSRPTPARSHVAIQPIPALGKPIIEPTIYSIPDEIVERSLGHYERNQLAWLLQDHFGTPVANQLLNQFQIGTSSRWPGACVFWFIDELNRKRGGQIKLFGNDWHTVKYIDPKGRRRTKTDWMHSAYAYRLNQQGQSMPDWLSGYIEQHEFSPCLFGLPQLVTAPPNQPIAIVEAPKTAILCSPYFPQFVWLAVGALSYLNVRESGLQRMAPLKGRSIVLFPDLSPNGRTFDKWSRIADELREAGFQIIVSDYLEQRATDDEKANGLDLADYILNQWKGYPPSWDELLPAETVPTLTVQSIETYLNNENTTNEYPSLGPLPI